jgi:hypothetical protein
MEEWRVVMIAAEAASTLNAANAGLVLMVLTNTIIAINLL